ncbi:MAG: PVC-type heme-binding CxxCH protein [Verrucomicrobiota bacterium]|nr:PVC-type heme-binding CxxCH protein [Verrucomicrobiota bacterium]
MKIVSFICMFAGGLGVFASEPPMDLAGEDVVVFLGGTDMVRAQRSGHLETLLTWHFKNEPPKFRDLSWEADTVFALGTETERWRRGGYRGINALGNLEKQLDDLKATAVLVQLGKNEAFAGGRGVEAFRQATEKLFERLTKNNRRLVVLSPIPFEKSTNSLLPDLTSRNDDLKLYVEALRQQTVKYESIFVDLFTNQELPLTQNGQHVASDKHAALASRTAVSMGIDRPSGFAGLEDLLTAVREKHRLWFNYWRPANWKCLFGDDNRRVFSIGSGKNVPSIRDERKKLPALIAAAEAKVVAVAKGLAKPVIASQVELPPPTPSLDPQDEKKEFKPAEGFAVTLFASEKLGVANPITMRWDAKGRMYVACTWSYPHLKPGEIPNDKIIQLVDMDGDGQADRSTVFADGLNIPTGLETADGGVYVGQATDLIFLRDLDEDGHADERRVLLSGFGTGDTHQAINSFTWSPDGELFFCQGDGIESRVETPWGVSSLYQAGVYRLRPRRLHLDGLLDDFMGPGNPWGVVFDEWGQSLVVDGAGGVSYLTPASIPAKHRLRLDRIGNPGGYCGVEMINGRHLPESMQGQFVLNDFKSNTVKRFALIPDGSGFKLDWKEPVLKSSHRNFRPVDIRIGPDGAIYIADFYNSIICHQDDYFRDPTRDLHHGRIWRLSVKDSPLAPKPNIVGESIEELLEQLKSPERWTRQQVKFELGKRDVSEVGEAAVSWALRLKKDDKLFERHQFEALALCATIESVQPQLLRLVLRAKDHRARAFAARIVGRWQDRLSKPVELLALAASDPHPQVRLEAALACGQTPYPGAIKVAALAVMKHPRDKWIDYAFTQAVRHQEPVWMAALTAGDLDFEDNIDALSALLEKGGSKTMLSKLMHLAKSDEIGLEGRRGVLNGIAGIGGEGELRAIFEPGFHRSAESHALALAALNAAFVSRRVKPEGDLAAVLGSALRSDQAELREQALGLIGQWQVVDLHDDITALVDDNQSVGAVRLAAVRALGLLGGDDTKLLAKLIDSGNATEELKLAALESLGRLSMSTAADHGARLLVGGGDSARILAAFLNREGGGKALTAALAKHKIKAGPAAVALAKLQSLGSSEMELMNFLSQTAGIKNTVPAYSAEFVAALAKESTKGNTVNGRQTFQTAGCAVCHKIGPATNNGLPFIGPELDTIGNTLSTERIIEEVLWPGRHVKEGFSLMQVTTRSGTIHQGYEQQSRSKDILIRPLSQPGIIRIPQDQVREQTQVGSAMPTGLTAGLKRVQLRDLIRFLAQQGRN